MRLQIITADLFINANMHTVQPKAPHVQAFLEDVVATASIQIPCSEDLGAWAPDDVYSLLAATPAQASRPAQLLIEAQVLPRHASALSEAFLQHSPSLSALYVDANFLPDAFLQVLPAMGHLTRLTALRLSLPQQISDRCPRLRATVDGFANTIRSLTSLVEVDIDVITLDNCAPRAILRKLAHRSDAPATFDPIIGALSHAPSLSSLTLNCKVPWGEDALPCSGIMGPFPSLRALQVDDPEPKENETGGYMITVSPLPVLTRLTMLGVSRDHVVVDSFLQQSTLQHAKLQLREPSMVNPPQMLERHLPALTALRGMTMYLYDRQESDPTLATCLYHIARGIAQLHALTSLYLDMPQVPENKQYGNAGSLILQSLSSLTALQCLQCELVDHSYHPEDDDDPRPICYMAEPLMGHALQRMTMLTHLHVEATTRAYKLPLPACFLEGLPALPALRALYMSALPFKSDNQVPSAPCNVPHLHVCLPSIPQPLLHLNPPAHTHDASVLQAIQWIQSLHLSHMTALDITLAPVSRAVILTLAQRLNGAPRMQQVVVSGYDTIRTPSRGWTQGLLQLPPRGEYRITWAGAIHDDDATMCQRLFEQGCTVHSEDWYNCLKYNEDPVTAPKIVPRTRFLSAY